jgi:hypothetical protein
VKYLVICSFLWRARVSLKCLRLARQGLRPSPQIPATSEHFLATRYPSITPAASYLFPPNHAYSYIQKPFQGNTHTMRSAPPPNKKRKIKTVHEEKIDFDPAAREEYLTGFHKRKLARRKFAEDENIKKEKEEKLRFRKEVRVGEAYITAHHSTQTYRAA